MLILDYDFFEVTKEENRYIYRDLDTNETSELELIASKRITPFSEQDSDDYLLNLYPEADVTGEAYNDLVYYWFKFKEVTNHD